MELNQLEDGVSHLNLYSNAKTELGRFCSNFTRSPIDTEDGHFESIEGYWGWLSFSEGNPRREEFRTVVGVAAKNLKNELLKNGDLGRLEFHFNQKIQDAIHLKFQKPEAKALLENNLELLKLPLVHYYYYHDNGIPKLVDVTNQYPEFIHAIQTEFQSFLQRRPSLFGISKGVICQQVNCQDVMGAGLAKVILEQYPEVASKYHESFQKNTKESLFGKVQLVQIGPELYVANIFSQFSYGNPQKSGKIYTNADRLVKAVNGICIKMNHLPVYLPHSKHMEGKEEYGIGCGYGGENWENLSKRFIDLHRENLHLLDTNLGIVHEFLEKSKMVGESILNSYTHDRPKHPIAIGVSEVGQKILQYQLDIAKKYQYQVLPIAIKEEALSIYLGNLPSEFLGAKREVKGGFEIEGKQQPLYLKNGIKIAEKYNRIVIGNYGAFFEIDKDDMRLSELSTQSGEEYRESESYKPKYLWKTVKDTNVKIYEQLGGVDYADYKPGKYYVSPYEVAGKEEMLEFGLPWSYQFSGFPMNKNEIQLFPNIEENLYKNRPIIFDTETTGFSPEKGEEVVQITLVNEMGQSILNTYLKPYCKTQWKQAQAIHHISPLMVQTSPHLDQYSDFLQTVFDKASVIVGHNVAFDVRFVEKCGKVTIDKKKTFDTMSCFKKEAPSLKHKLDDAVQYYCPEYYQTYKNGAHNSYYDTVATAKVYVAMMEKEKLFYMDCEQELGI